MRYFPNLRRVNCFVVSRLAALRAGPFGHPRRTNREAETETPQSLGCSRPHQKGESKGRKRPKMAAGHKPQPKRPRGPNGSYLLTHWTPGASRSTSSPNTDINKCKMYIDHYTIGYNCIPF